MLKPGISHGLLPSTGYCAAAHHQKHIDKLEHSLFLPAWNGMRWDKMQLHQSDMCDHCNMRRPDIY